MIEHLTATELDALLEAARACSQGALALQGGHGITLDFRKLANPATITRLVLMVRELRDRMIDAIEAADMEANRALGFQDARDKFAELADKRHDELSQARRQRDSMAANLDKYSRELVEHFRARAVRALRDKSAVLGTERDKYGQAESSITYLSLHNQSLLASELATTIESLPLVEKEEE